MNILVTGGTGFVGKALVTALLSHGDSVTVLTRSIEKAQSVFPEKTPQFLTALSTLKDLNAFDAVINLAGEPIFDKRWTAQQKEKLRHSRINLTQQIVQLINQSEYPPSPDFRFRNGNLWKLWRRRDHRRYQSKYSIYRATLY